MKRWRCLSIVLLFTLGSSVYPYTLPATAQDLSSQDPNSVVPVEFAGDMEWSEQGNWHWVFYSYSGDNVTTAVYTAPPQLVATNVRTLAPDDQCQDCVVLGETTQGPPSILGGPDNPALAGAYENLNNGPRYKITDAVGDDDAAIWAAGAWYLNYNPVTDRFTSWTWIPDSQGSAELLTAVEDDSLEFEFGEAGDFLAWLPEGSRVFPLAPGSYTITQNFGCVGHNHGYASVSTCPPDRPSFHNGTDFGAPEGTTIYAAASGTVSFADIDSSSSSGNSVIAIDHDGVNGAYRTEYLHWIRSYVKAGDYVYAGQPIAEVGSVGYSTGPHLHFTVRDLATGIAIDPMIWLTASVAPLPQTISVNSAAVMNVLRWEPMIRAASEKYDVPMALIAAIMTVESGGNPNALSPAGAQGLMQVMPMHFMRFGIPSELWRDPATNIDTGTRYLSELRTDYRSLEETVARYFGIGCDVLGTCTDHYVSMVLSWYAYFTALFSGDPLPGLPEPVAVTSTPAPQTAPAPQQPAPTQEPPVTESEPVEQPEHEVPAPPADEHVDEPPEPEPAPDEPPAEEQPSEEQTEEHHEESEPDTPAETPESESVEEPNHEEPEQQPETESPEQQHQEEGEPEQEQSPEPDSTQDASEPENQDPQPDVEQDDPSEQQTAPEPDQADDEQESESTESQPVDQENVEEQPAEEPQEPHEEPAAEGAETRETVEHEEPQEHESEEHSDTVEGVQNEQADGEESGATQESELPVEGEQQTTEESDVTIDMNRDDAESGEPESDAGEQDAGEPETFDAPSTDVVDRPPEDDPVIDDEEVDTGEADGDLENDEDEQSTYPIPQLSTS